MAASPRVDAARAMVALLMPAACSSQQPGRRCAITATRFCTLDRRLAVNAPCVCRDVDGRAEHGAIER